MKYQKQQTFSVRKIQSRSFTTVRRLYGMIESDGFQPIFQL